MHESHPIEVELNAEAQRLSQKYKSAPVLVIVGGSAEAEVPRCMLGSSLHNGKRLRDLLGILETAKQIETSKHFGCLVFAGPGAGRHCHKHE